MMMILTKPFNTERILVFLNLENARRGYNEIMMIENENQKYNENMEESMEDTLQLRTGKALTLNSTKLFKRSTRNKTFIKRS